jgi:hypothetical protein
VESTALPRRGVGARIAPVSKHDLLAALGRFASPVSFLMLIPAFFLEGRDVLAFYAGVAALAAAWLSALVAAARTTGPARPHRLLAALALPPTLVHIGGVALDVPLLVSMPVPAAALAFVVVVGVLHLPERGADTASTRGRAAQRSR